MGVLLGDMIPVEEMRPFTTEEAWLIQNFKKDAFEMIRNHATGLHEAARREYKDYVIEIIEFDPSLVSSVNVDRDTPLHFAARTGNTSILVKMLESNKEACTKINKQGETAFILACVNNHVDAAIILVEEATSMMMVELDAAFSAHHPVIVDKILKRFLRLVSDVDKEQSMHKACEVGNLEMVRKLLNVDQRIAERVNNDGLTPLHYAAMNGSVEILKEFLDKAPSSFSIGIILNEMAHNENIGKLLYNPDAEGNTVLHCNIRIPSRFLVV